MIPALQMIPSIGAFRALTVATLARTEVGSASSHATGVVSLFTEAQAVRAFSKVRAAAITWAPRNVSTRRVSNPRPELQPVRRYVFPATHLLYQSAGSPGGRRNETAPSALEADLPRLNRRPPSTGGQVWRPISLEAVSELE